MKRQFMIELKDGRRALVEGDYLIGNTLFSMVWVYDEEDKMIAEFRGVLHAYPEPSRVWLEEAVVPSGVRG